MWCTLPGFAMLSVNRLRERWADATAVLSDRHLTWLVHATIDDPFREWNSFARATGSNTAGVQVGIQLSSTPS